jgi:ADP-heptose:LPS heptosyltransferase
MARANDFVRAAIITGVAIAARLTQSSTARDLRTARRVLFLRPDRIGDMVMSTGILRALATSGARPDVNVLASPSNAPVLQHCPWVRKVHVVGRGGAELRRAWPTLRAEHYDAVIDGLVLKRGVNTGTALLMLASHAPARVGVGGRARDNIYTHRVRPAKSDAHHVEYLAALLRPFGIEGTPDVAPEVCLSDVERAAGEAFWSAAPGEGLRVLVNVSAGQELCRWDADNYVAVLRALRASHPNTRIGVTAMPNERARAASVASDFGGHVFTGNLREAFGVVAGADVVLTPDTGLAHVAAALRRSTVVMLPRATSPQFIPYALIGRAIYSESDSLDTLRPAAVTGAALAVLAEAR